MYDKDFDHRSVFGAGFYAGREAERNEREEMILNQARQLRLISGMSQIAQRVFDCVPIGEAWDAKRISGEYTRTNGTSPSVSITGCLNSLKSSGLVSEPERGIFKRCCNKQTLKSVPKQKEEEPEMKTTKTKSAMTDKNPSPIEKIEGLVIKIFDLSSELEEALEELKAEMAGAEEQAGKMKQLQQLLKSIT